jgi:hypothetical protein
VNDTVLQRNWLAEITSVLSNFNCSCGEYDYRCIVVKGSRFKEHDLILLVRLLTSLAAMLLVRNLVFNSTSTFWVPLSAFKIIV